MGLNTRILLFFVFSCQYIHSCVFPEMTGPLATLLNPPLSVLQIFLIISMICIHVYEASLVTACKIIINNLQQAAILNFAKKAKS